MIVPMKKVTLIVQSKDASLVVERLRALGILHVEHTRPPAGRDLNLIREDIQLLEEAIRVIAGRRFSQGREASQDEELGDWRSVAGHIIDLGKREEQLKDYARALIKEINEWEAWGDFEPELIHRLAEKNIYVRLYQIPEREIRDIPEDVVVERISRVKGIVDCLVISRRKIELPFREPSLPKMGLEKMKKRLAENAQAISSLRGYLEKQVSYYNNFRRLRESLEKEREFQEAIRGMGEIENLSYLKGYLPEDATQTILATAQKEAWGILIEEPSEEDRVPTLLRNPRWVAILNPVFKMLEIFPGYRELDISLWFLIFFSIFFGLLIGDVGYGGLYLVLTFLAKKKWGRRLRETSLFNLFYLLSLSAIIWGLLSGTFFGQEWLAGLVRPLIPGLRSERNIQVLCFFLGAFHLSIAHIWRLLLKVPSWVALVELGWIFILWGVFFLARTLILGELFPALGRLFFILGAFLVLFFTSPQRNIFKGITKGLGNFLLHLVNNFTDVVSYIRLFAVGLATVAMADAFNKLACEVGYHNIISGIATSLILVSGHLLNLLLGPLSVLVHGVRLNVLEFCNHLEVKWSGFGYKPLKK